MPKKASGPKKARWTTAQKSEARKAPKKAHHRGQPDGPKSAPKRAARAESGEYTKRPRAVIGVLSSIGVVFFLCMIWLSVLVFGLSPRFVG